MDQDTINSLLKEYDDSCIHYGLYTHSVERLVNELLKVNAIRVHSVTSRLKEKGSFLKKIQNPDAIYSSITEVTDVCGVRIITYFPDDVDRVASIISTEFDVDPINSVDKRALLDPDRFGYLSLHYVVSLSNKRLRLTEYKDFKSCKAEIQIRSILQHAWAEIEHDLGYKGKLSVPRDIRRRFSQLAGMLELTDSEFARIRDYLKDYESSLSARISTDSSLVLIDSASLKSFIETSELVHEVDQLFSSSLRTKLSDSMATDDFDIWRLNHAGFNSIADIESGLSEYKQEIPKISKFFASKGGKYPRGISIFYLAYSKLIIQGNSEILADILLAAKKIIARATKSKDIPSRTLCLREAREIIDNYNKQNYNFFYKHKF